MLALAFQNMVQPSMWTTVVFVILCIGLAISLVCAVRRGAPPEEAAETTQRWMIGTAIGAALWLALTGIISGSGILEGGSGMPPRLMLFFGGSNIAMVALAFSPLGRRLATGTPIWALIAFQGFRLPLEVVLHSWWNEGVLPVQMTYSGHNFDIITGILALLVGLSMRRRAPSVKLVLGFNLIGFALLITVASIAALSSPTPLQSYTSGPSVQLAYHFPYGWIVPICVSGALFGHLVVFRWLWLQRKAGIPCAGLNPPSTPQKNRKA